MIQSKYLKRLQESNFQPKRTEMQLNFLTIPFCKKKLDCDRLMNEQRCRLLNSPQQEEDMNQLHIYVGFFLGGLIVILFGTVAMVKILIG